jgi:hypothetical protein
MREVEDIRIDNNEDLIKQMEKSGTLIPGIGLKIILI